MNSDYNSLVKMLNNSEVLYTYEQLETRILELAQNIEKEIFGKTPTFLTVMNGGMFFGAELLKHISSPIIVDYIHASRYGHETFGASHITWFRQPPIEIIKGRDVYIVDDILDEGFTLSEISRVIMDLGAHSCKFIVLIDKDLNKAKPIKADHYGFKAPNKFLFGFGMDINGIFRQLKNIYIYQN